MGGKQSFIKVAGRSSVFLSFNRREDGFVIALIEHSQRLSALFCCLQLVLPGSVLPRVYIEMHLMGAFNMYDVSRNQYVVLFPRIIMEVFSITCCDYFNNLYYSSADIISLDTNISFTELLRKCCEILLYSSWYWQAFWCLSAYLGNLVYHHLKMLRDMK